MNVEQPLLPGTSLGGTSPRAVWDGFHAPRLTQARRLAGLTKREVADGIGVSAAAVGQYEAGTNRPRPELIPRLADVLDVPIQFFVAGRPMGKVDSSMAHFRALRSTSGAQRERALGFVEQVWELTHALEKRVQLPPVNLPGFTGGEVSPGAELPEDPVGAARALRQHWGLGDGPVRHLARRMEANGLIVVAPAEAEEAAAKVDAFSSSGLLRPVVVLTPNRADDVYRYRFSAAHELGHLVLHAGATGDNRLEREADAFAAEFLTPQKSIHPLLPRRVDLAQLAGLSQTWGVSVNSLVYRYRELGLVSDATISRAYKRLRELSTQPGFAPQSIRGYPGEQPVMLSKAFELAEQDTGLTIRVLAAELAWKPVRVRELLGMPDSRPVLRIV